MLHRFIYDNIHYSHIEHLTVIEQLHNHYLFQVDYHILCHIYVHNYIFKLYSINSHTFVSQEWAGYLCGSFLLFIALIVAAVGSTYQYIVTLEDGRRRLVESSPIVAATVSDCCCL